MRQTNFILYFTVFIISSTVMIFELLGSRILAPYFGTSLYVWTSLLGIIMASLSFGYYYGGKLADQSTNLKNLSIIILFAALSIFLTVFIKDYFLLWLRQELAFLDMRFSSLIACLVLFAPANVFFGIISPYIAKIKIHNQTNQGAILGRLSALGATGSIFGTFLGGFLLIPHLATTTILIILASSLVLLTLFINIFNYKKTLTILILLIIIFSKTQLTHPATKLFKKFKEIDTLYNKIWLFESLDQDKKQPVLNLVMDPEGIQSSMFLDKNNTDLVALYTKFYRLGQHFKPDLKNVLMIGGCGYSYPKDFLKSFPEGQIDVVEIDPGMTKIAQQYFRLPNDPRLKIYHEDGRVYLNNNQKQYDVILGDAFNSASSIPYQLTTKEAIQRQYNSLVDDGVVIINIASAVTGPQSKFLQAEYKTFKEIFPQVYVFPLDANKTSDKQNIMLVALKNKTIASLKSDNQEFQKYLSYLKLDELKTDLPILTDEFAPTEYYSL